MSDVWYLYRLILLENKNPKQAPSHGVAEAPGSHQYIITKKFEEIETPRKPVLLGEGSENPKSCPRKSWMSLSS